MNGIRVSEKYGVNPSLTVCYYCGKDDGGIALLGRLNGDAEAPRRIVANREPCKECEGWMAKGIILLEVVAETISDEPDRTGNLWVITEEAARRLFREPALSAALARRCVFVPRSVTLRLGLEPAKKEATQ